MVLKQLEADEVLSTLPKRLSIRIGTTLVGYCTKHRLSLTLTSQLAS